MFENTVKTGTHILLLTAMLLAIVVLPLQAQPVNDGATNTLSSGTHIFGGDVTVGTNGSSTLLILTNNAWLTNSGHGYVGRNPGANTNTVRLAGPDTRWRMSGDVFTGRDGAGNQLVVSNGSVVRNRDGYVGYGVASSGNLALVTDEGFWTNVTTLYVGFQGAGNQLVVSNNAVVGSTSGYLGYFSTGNVAVVTGTDSLWANALEFAVGYNGGANQLMVNNGGLVRDADGYLGYGSTSGGNVAVVTGAGSLWLNDFDLHVGKFGAGNQLLVGSGGAVGDINGILGSGATSSSSNVAVVTGAGSLWLNSGDLYVGAVGAGNQLVVSNGASVWCDQGIFGYGVTSSNNAALVTGAGSLWTNATFFNMGFNGPGNQLVVANGGVVWNQSGTIGINSTSTNNMVVVTGPGSFWVNDLSLIVGYISSGNHLVVSNGGAVRDYSGYIGTWVQFSNNTALVTGTGSLWTNLADLVVGEAGRHNQLVVTNGGVVRNTTGTVGRNSGADFNLALVTGAGSLWTNSGNLLIGSNGAFNQIIVSAGGSVRADRGYVGYSSNSANNSAVVTGAGSRWTNESHFFLGYYGAGNRLVVTNGAVVRNDIAYIGLTPSSTSNAVMVTGAGSRWQSDGGLYVGMSGAGNQLVVSNGGVMTGYYSRLGNYPSSNNTVVVTGPGSRLENESSLYVGTGGPGNRLLVSDGGVVQGQFASLGYNDSIQPTSRSNAAVVTGTGSLWTNAASLIIGHYDEGNQLVVSNGGVVCNSYGALGYFSFTPNNAAVVTGVGSRWENRGDLEVGAGGAGNQLVVSNGAVVRSSAGYVGHHSTSSSNVALVTGAGSLWTNEFNLGVGYNGSGNQLVVTNGGAVRNSNGYLGYSGYLNFLSTRSSNNVALVTGANSLWWNYFDLFVGLNGVGSQLVVSNGAVVRDYAGCLGFNIESSNNTAVVTGEGSLWTNESTLTVGAIGSGNQLEVRNGGVVRDSIGYIGSNSISGNNTAIVTDAGSLWTNALALFVGYNGAFNQLVVSAGGKVRAGGPITLGATGVANNNSVLATGGSLGSVGLNLGGAASRNNSVTLLSGSNWDVGGGAFIWGNAGIGDTLTIDASSALTNIGALWLDETATTFHLTNAPGGYTLNGFTTNQFQFKTNGLGTLVVGNDGTNVQLTISNSTLASTTGTIGNNAVARSNLVLVAGAGSVWSNSGALNIGNSGAFNRLVVSNGGAVRAGGLLTLGNAAGSTNNSVLAVGGSLSSAGLTLGNVQSRNNNVMLLTGSVWDVGAGTFTWGNAGFNDTLAIDATSSMTNIGALTLDENNTAFALTSGPGGSALNGMAVRLKPTGFGALVVGNDGTNVQLTISNTLADTTGTIGNSITAVSNSVVVTGAGSLWTNSGTLTIGNNGAFNQLIVSNAATVSASNNIVVGRNSGALNNSLLVSTGAWLTNGGDGVLGWNPGANGNSAFVSGTNSRWHVGGSLCVGTNGAFNQLIVSNGGTVIAGSGLSVFTGGGVFVGANAGAANNLLSLSSGAQMTNGGNVALGWNTGANSNTVSVSGANTRWQLLLYAYVFVGNSGAGNRLVISNGAQVKQTGNTLAYIGYNSSAINNEVVVTGTNSLWTMGDLTVGLHGGGSRMVISEGARVDSAGNAWIGPPNAAAPSPVSNNVVLVTGANSRWTISSGLTVGNSGNGSLVISNGGGVDSFGGIIGVHSVFGGNNGALVTGANSYWSNQNAFTVGQGASGISLVISNGGKVDNSFATIGSLTTADTNEVVVTGAGSFWNNRNELYVGYDGNGNRLTITNGGGVRANNGLYVGFGFFASPTNNRVTVGGGSLTVTNLAGNSTLDIRRGTNFLLSGTMDVDRLRLTNVAGSFAFSSGTLKSKATTNSNGQTFTVGNGTSAATLELVGTGLHTFNSGLAISGNAALRGNGTISGALTVAVGGTLSPGTSVGKITLSNAPALQGTTVMEISRNGVVLTNDQLQVAGPLTYGGSLTVSNLGPGALTTGNSFQLFSASAYGGAFAALSLPVLDVGLSWTNKLLVNGSIEVIGVALPKISTTTLSGTNVIIAGSNGVPNAPYAVLTSTNVALPMSNWVSIATNQFDSSGNFSFTYGIAPGIPLRFFRLRTP